MKTEPVKNEAGLCSTGSTCTKPPLSLSLPCMRLLPAGVSFCSILCCFRLWKCFGLLKRYETPAALRLSSVHIMHGGHAVLSQLVIWDISVYSGTNFKAVLVFACIRYYCCNKFAICWMPDGLHLIIASIGVVLRIPFMASAVSFPACLSQGFTEQLFDMKFQSCHKNESEVQSILRRFVIGYS